MSSSQIRKLLLASKGLDGAKISVAEKRMLEALAQSRWPPMASEIEFLPALPRQWTEGSVQGLRARGGAALDTRWRDGKVMSLELHVTAGGTMRLIPPAGQSIAYVTGAAGRTVPVSADGTIHLHRGTPIG